jgi:hypothetical protein
LIPAPLATNTMAPQTCGAFYLDFGDEYNIETCHATREHRPHIRNMPVKTRTWIRLTVLVLLMTPIYVVSFQSQVTKGRKAREKVWFIARVVSTEPFMLEYLDDWYLHQSDVSNDYGFAMDTNPQARTEDVSKFKLGDIIGGEFCIPLIDNCPPSVNVWQPGEELSIPPPIAINLRRLGNEYKYKYRNKGLLLSYRRSEKNIITSLSIFRDGTLDLGSFDSGGLRRKLSKSELKALEKAFFDNRTDKIESSKTAEYFKVGLTTVFGKFRDLRVDESSKEDVAFFSLLDDLIQKQVLGASYRINYRWRYRIKDWQFGGAFPLDEAIDKSYLSKHWKTLSDTMAPTDLFEEARERLYEKPNPDFYQYFYRYKNRLYSVEFPTCTNRPTGSWACVRLAELGKPLDDGRVWMSFDEWPKDLRLKLEEIPRGGLINNESRFGKGVEVPTFDIEKHREFFDRLLRGGPAFREGEYIYYGLKVWFQ